MQPDFIVATNFVILNVEITPTFVTKVEEEVLDITIKLVARVLSTM